MKETLGIEHICVHDGDREAHLVLRYAAWLSLELNPIYREAVAELRERERRIAQATDLTSADGIRLMRKLLSKALNRVVELGMTDIIAVVSPEHARDFSAMAFDDMLPDDPPRVWDLARDVDGDFLPTRLIRLDILALPKAKLAEWRAVQTAE